MRERTSGAKQWAAAGPRRGALGAGSGGPSAAQQSAARRAAAAAAAAAAAGRGRAHPTTLRSPPVFPLALTARPAAVTNLRSRDSSPLRRPAAGGARGME
jgi:hypothetical protein